MELPPQSPESPVMADRSREEAEEKVMSRKSALVKEVVALVIDFAVPRVPERIKTLFVAEFPLIDFPFMPTAVPLIVKLINFDAMKERLSPRVNVVPAENVTLGINNPPVVNVAPVDIVRVDVSVGVYVIPETKVAFPPTVNVTPAFCVKVFV